MPHMHWVARQNKLGLPNDEDRQGAADHRLTSQRRRCAKEVAKTDTCSRKKKVVSRDGCSKELPKCFIGRCKRVPFGFFFVNFWLTSKFTTSTFGTKSRRHVYF